MRGLCNTNKLGGSITRIVIIVEGLGVVVIDNTGPMVNVMMRVGAGQILEDDGSGEGGDEIKIRLAAERNVLCFLHASLLHACAIPTLSSLAYIYVCYHNANVALETIVSCSSLHLILP